MSKINLLFGLALLGFSITANATLIKSYDFDGGLSDTLGNGVDMVASGGTIAGGRYSFSRNQGLRLTSALPSTTDYAIELRLSINDSLSGYNKLIDFQDLGSDFGLYEYNGALDFYRAGPAAGTVPLSNDFTVGLARSAGTIELFLNGTSLFSAPDYGQAVSASNILNFFEDDTDTGQNESFVGSVDWIRIHNDSSTFGTEPTAAVPEPATLALFGIGLIALGFRIRQTKRQIGHPLR